MKKLKNILLILVFGATVISCKKYIDIVPDNIATIDYAFRLRNTAERYLFTCYSFLPNYPGYAGGFLNVGDELIYVGPYRNTGFDIIEGLQNSNSPLLDYWNGERGGKKIFRALRECNIFLENIEKVPDLQEHERKQWIAEVKTLKAYYHFFLMSLYGPIPVIKENVPIYADPELVRVTRRPIEEVSDYIAQLVDEAVADLPLVVNNRETELGRITQPIALAIKAKALVYAASPLFNGNPDYHGFTNKDGTQLISTTYDENKWVRAAAACKAAIDTAHEAGNKLYYFVETSQARNLSEETKTVLSVINPVSERWNVEVIWALTNTGSMQIQLESVPPKMDQAGIGRGENHLAVPFKVVSQFYTKNGVPIEEDVTWDYAGRLDLKVVPASEKYYLGTDYTTASFNLDREPRFYGNFFFDGGIVFGLGNFDETKSKYMQSKVGQPQGKEGPWSHPRTGYGPKKYVYYGNSYSGTALLRTDYPWPLIRLADLYLLYAEALNESQGPVEEVFTYLDMIRERAGLKGVKESWTNFSRNATKFATKEGLRSIIRRERMIELALEGQRHFDLRRWKEAINELNKPITGWDMDQSLVQFYYRERTLLRPSFSTRDYLWPLRESDLIINKNLVQNPGW